MTPEHWAGRRIHVQGIVQGVGFRPFVYGLAVRHGLRGWVLNNSSGVEIEVFGADGALDAFVRELDMDKPPLAVIDVLTVQPIAGEPPVAFTIRHSAAQPDAFVPVSPDVAVCDDCLRELFDPQDRRYRYPFINCTNCGPRFTIVRDIPYDRPLTTMAPFVMCPTCQAEYENPANRRFHAQPNACPDCGPMLQLLASPGADDARLGLAEPLAGDAALLHAQRLLDSGHIVAVKGLGGYHLACDATDDAAVLTLRSRKGRVGKPLAVMAPDLDTVRSFAHVTPAEARLLTSRERPIVLLRKRKHDGRNVGAGAGKDAGAPGARLSEHVAPGNLTVGVMLPYTPLHHLLLHRDETSSTPAPVYVMTSGNLSEEPIVKDDDQALERIAPLADAFLLHNRAIHIHCDDSVVRVFREEALPIRRARGYAPFPVRLPHVLRPILAVGGELKNTFCLTNGRYAFLSQHMGDMENLETLRAFEAAVEHFARIFRVRPEWVARDMHPAYLSTRWAEAYAAQNGLPVIAVQHHHAHIAGVMAEHGLDNDDRVIGVALDGTGYGTDGTIWGGEILVASYNSFQRVGALRPVPLPGGDAAIRRPYRVALAHLWAAGMAWDEALPPVAACPPEERRILKRQLETGLNTVPTSSMGRLFDAVAALAGVRQTVTYEAQAAMEFEALAQESGSTAYDVQDVIRPVQASPLHDSRATDRRGGILNARRTLGKAHLQVTAAKSSSQESRERPVEPASLQSGVSEVQFEIDPRPVLRQLVQDVLAGTAPGVISFRFHQAMADVVRDACLAARDLSGLHTVALSGGVFQNVLLLGAVLDRLQSSGFKALTHLHIPANDGGLALGQALVAHYTHDSRRMTNDE